MTGFALPAVPWPVLAVTVAAVASGCLAAWRSTPRATTAAVLAFVGALTVRAAGLDAATAAAAVACGVAIAAAARTLEPRPAFLWAAATLAVTAWAPLRRGDTEHLLLTVPAVVALAAAAVAVAARLAVLPTRRAVALVAALAPIGPAAASAFVVTDAAVVLDLVPTAAGSVVTGALACAPDPWAAGAALGAVGASWSWLPAALTVWFVAVWLRRPAPVPWAFAWLPALAGGALMAIDLAAVAQGCARVSVPGLALPVPLVAGGRLDPTLWGLHGVRIALVMALALPRQPPLAPAAAPPDPPPHIPPTVRRALLVTFLAGTVWLAVASILGPGRSGATWFADPAAHSAAATAAAAGIAWRGADRRWSAVHGLALLVAAIAAATWVGGAAAGWATAGHLTPVP